MSRTLRALLGLSFVLFLCSAANALILDLDDCNSFGCQGSDVSLQVTAAGGGDWNVILKLDSTGYTGTKSGVVQAGFKAIAGASVVSLVSYSDGSWSTAKKAGVSSSGACAGPSSSDFVCTSGYANIQTDKEYSWNFLVKGGSVLDEWTIKFQYGNATGTNNGNLISAPGVPTEPGSPAPEPSAALLFAAGLLIAGARRRALR